MRFTPPCFLFRTPSQQAIHSELDVLRPAASAYVMNVVSPNRRIRSCVLVPAVTLQCYAIAFTFFMHRRAVAFIVDMSDHRATVVPHCIRHSLPPVFTLCRALPRQLIVVGTPTREHIAFAYVPSSTTQHHTNATPRTCAASLFFVRQSPTRAHQSPFLCLVASAGTCNATPRKFVASLFLHCCAVANARAPFAFLVQCRAMQTNRRRFCIRAHFAVSVLCLFVFSLFFLSDSCAKWGHCCLSHRNFGRSLRLGSLIIAPRLGCCFGLSPLRILLGLSVLCVLLPLGGYGQDATRNSTRIPPSRCSRVFQFGR